MSDMHCATGRCCSSQRGEIVYRPALCFSQRNNTPICEFASVMQGKQQQLVADLAVKSDTNFCGRQCWILKYNPRYIFLNILGEHLKLDSLSANIYRIIFGFLIVYICPAGICCCGLYRSCCLYRISVTINANQLAAGCCVYVGCLSMAQPRAATLPLCIQHVRYTTSKCLLFPSSVFFKNFPADERCCYRFYGFFSSHMHEITPIE
ncbi:hypothetical protein GJV44_00334 [Candidatus Vallotia cooleyia]|nr:hypothetical protein GJV44_00334 [Candidatus Vallotia cooleyia]